MAVRVRAAICIYRKNNYRKNNYDNNDTDIYFDIVRSYENEE